jgi:hypothetical protein
MHEIDLELYQTQALRTCKQMPTPIENILHMVLGITSEYFESEEARIQSVTKEGIGIDQRIALTDNHSKELGDIMWYLAGLCHFANLEFDFDGNKSNNDVKKAIETLNSVYKAHWVYNRSLEQPDKTGKTPLQQAQRSVHAILNWITDQPFYLQNILDANIAKLAARYPEQYSDFHANNRKETDLQ